MQPTNPMRRTAATVVAALLFSGGGVWGAARQATHDTGPISQVIHFAGRIFGDSDIGSEGAPIRSATEVLHQHVDTATAGLRSEEVRYAVQTGCDVWDAFEDAEALQSPERSEQAEALGELQGDVRSKFPDPQGRALSVESAAADIVEELSNYSRGENISPRKLTCGAVGLFP
jgi:hypothetical protein